jgi:hypothetical protein
MGEKWSAATLGKKGKGTGITHLARSPLVAPSSLLVIVYKYTMEATVGLAILNYA